MENEVVGPDQLEDLLVPVKHDQPGNSAGEVEADGEALLQLLDLSIPVEQVGAKSYK